jgi:hypothetical protein
MLHLYENPGTLVEQNEVVRSWTFCLGRKSRRRDDRPTAQVADFMKLLALTMLTQEPNC